MSLQQNKLLATWEDRLIWLRVGTMHYFCLANSRKRSNGFGPQRSWQNWPSIKKSSSQQNRAKIRRATHSLTILGHHGHFQGFAYSSPSHHIKEFCLSNISFQYIINEPIQVDSNLGFDKTVLSFLGPRGPLVEPSILHPSHPPVRNNFS